MKILILALLCSGFILGAENTKVPPAAPAVSQNVRSLPDPEPLNTALNPVPELDHRGKLGEVDTLGPLPAEISSDIELRQAQEEDPEDKEEKLNK